MIREAISSAICLTIAAAFVAAAGGLASIPAPLPLTIGLWLASALCVTNAVVAVAIGFIGYAEALLPLFKKAGGQ